MEKYHPVIFLCIAVYGLFSFFNYKKVLRRKYGEEELPERRVRMYRGVSLALVVLGVLFAILSYLDVL